MPFSEAVLKALFMTSLGGVNGTADCHPTQRWAHENISVLTLLIRCTWHMQLLALHPSQNDHERQSF